MTGADQRSRVEGCQLCAAARITPWFHEDEVCWIAECEICAVPMVVWRWHGTDPPAADLEHMRRALRDVGTREIGKCWLDEHMRNIPDHWHAHARPDGGFSRRGPRRPVSRPA
ncbi:MAG: hypothetical protein ACREJV_08270 [Candidatus Rokuibacteriota bacterium]